MFWKRYFIYNIFLNAIRYKRTRQFVLFFYVLAKFQLIQHGIFDFSTYFKDNPHIDIYLKKLLRYLYIMMSIFIGSIDTIRMVKGSRVNIKLYIVIGLWRCMFCNKGCVFRDSLERNHCILQKERKLQLSRVSTLGIFFLQFNIRNTMFVSSLFAG